MNKSVSIVITLGLIIALGIVFSGDVLKNKDINNVSDIQNVVVRDGVQYINISAKGGYTPNESIAKAGIPTKLIVKTANTFDCSSSLVINSLNYRKILPNNAETEIDIGVPRVGVPLQGVCGMGMYNFVVNFI